MRPKIFLGISVLLLAVMLGASGCGLTVNVAFATPTITAVIATSAPQGFVPPSLTPLPILSSPTVPPSTPTPTQTITPSPVSLGNAASVIQTVVPTLTPIPPTLTVPPPQPTQVVLPQLKVFDKDGNNMEGQVKGISVPKSLMSFQVIACVPDCKSKPDGAGIATVDFAFYKFKTEWRSDLNTKTPVYKTTEHNKPYCAFGGDSPCPVWIFADHGNKWPNGATIENGDYTLYVNATGTNNNNIWRSVVNFTIQR